MPILRIKLPDRPAAVTHVLDGERITIGRGPDNTIQINHCTVSKHHAELISIDGHYRLHDLDSTNRTCIEGQPVVDFHLLEKCRMRFGTIEAEFSPETPSDPDNANTEWVPTLAEFEFIKRENRELQSQVAAFARQFEILGSAPLVTGETTVRPISADAHARVVSERDVLQKENDDLRFDVENLRCDLISIMRERDALRQAWATVKGELSGVEEELARLRRDLTPGLQELVEEILEVPEKTPAPVETTAAEIFDAHRHLAELLITAPRVIDNLRRELKLISASPLDEISRHEAARHARTLVHYTDRIRGHQIQRLAAGIDALLDDINLRPGPFALNVLGTLKEAVNVISALLNSDVFGRAGNIPHPRVLAVENDEDTLATLTAALQIADIQVVAQREPTRVASPLLATEFDLVFIDNALPDLDELDLCNEIRALPGYSRTPILFLTSSNQVDGRAQSFLAGGSDFLCRPFNVLELTLKAETWIYRKQFGLLPRGLGAGDVEVGSVEIGLEALRQLP